MIITPALLCTLVRLSTLHPLSYCVSTKPQVFPADSSTGRLVTIRSREEYRVGQVPKKGMGRNPANLEL